ncbi:DUF4369 domain-containing protein [Lacinutrix jangbogonensis]|uniref:DUF4369 domain-containing protein n=1 Tax=Lacinutrix jangbogonensis TaxID=1469557 RepID=UPI00053D916A|nr:DUF4369 domain-containing protein [Lacinutrix jangbogonensis]
MLKKIVIIVLFIAFISCKKEKNDGFNISATTDSYISGSTARLFRVDNKKKSVLDSTILEKGTFVFEGKVTSPDRYYITIDNVLGVLPLIIANETFEIEITTDSIEGSKIIGSKENTIIKKYLEDLKYLQQAYGALSQKFNTYRLSDDKDGMQTVKNSYDSLVLEAVKFDVRFIKKHPNAVLSALTLERITMAKQIPVEETNTLFSNLSPDIQETRAAKYALEFIEEQSKKQ